MSYCILYSIISFFFPFLSLSFPLSIPLLAVIATVVLVILCLVVVLMRYMYRHKGTYHTNEAKGTEFAETADAALRGDPALQDAMDESKKEYFIWPKTQAEGCSLS